MATPSDLLNKILETEVPVEEKKPAEPVKKDPPPKLLRIVKISDNIISMNPLNIYMKSQIEEFDKINKELIVIASSISNNDLYAYGNRGINQSENAKVFFYEGVTVPIENICAIRNAIVDSLKGQILGGITEYLQATYNYTGKYNYVVINSYLQKFKDGGFIPPHDSHLNINIQGERPSLLLKVAYYVNNGDPDVNKLCSGFITFLDGDKLFDFTPQTGNLFIWENGIKNMMHPFYSKSGLDCTIMFSHILIEF